MKKYQLTSNTIKVNGKTLYQIRAFKDFSNVKAGDLGGWIESENNLSHNGDCWVYDNGCVYGDGRFFGDGMIDITKRDPVYTNLLLQRDNHIAFLERRLENANRKIEEIKKLLNDT